MEPHEISKTVDINRGKKSIIEQTITFSEILNFADNNSVAANKLDTGITTLGQNAVRIKSRVNKLNSLDSRGLVCTSRKCSINFFRDQVVNGRFYDQICYNASTCEWVTKLLMSNHNQEQKTHCDKCGCHNRCHLQLSQIRRINKQYEIHWNYVITIIDKKCLEYATCSNAMASITSQVKSQTAECNEIVRTFAKLILRLQNSFLIPISDEFINSLSGLAEDDNFDKNLKNIKEIYEDIKINFSDSASKSFEIDIQDFTSLKNSVANWKKNVFETKTMIKKLEAELECFSTSENIIDNKSLYSTPTFRKNKQIPDHIVKNIVSENILEEEEESIQEIMYKDKEIAILLMGQSGVGKSTLINSVSNYFQFTNFESALKGEPKILIPTHFSIVDEDTKSHNLTFGSDRNETLDVGKAGTQEVKTYKFPIGNSEYSIRLIDTPGMGDPRGIDQDEQNFANIYKHMADSKKIHAICILMQPNVTRESILFTYCVKQMLSRLDKSAAKNITFLFSNSRSEHYSAGNTQTILRRIIRQIEQHSHISILLRNNIFSMDNEAFKVLLALSKGIRLSNQVKRLAGESWNVSSKAIWNLIKYITGDDSTRGLHALNVTRTIGINHVKNIIERLAHSLVYVSDLINVKLLDITKEEDNSTVIERTINELKARLNTSSSDVEVKKLTHLATICAGENCVEVVQFGTTQKRHFHRRCHDPCNCNLVDSIQLDTVNEKGLMNCLIMTNHQNCQHCGCHYTLHMRTYDQTSLVDGQIENQRVRQSILNEEEKLQQISLLLENIYRTKTELENEHETISEAITRFAQYLKQNAITPFNDSYKEYTEYLIAGERGKGDSADANLIRRLQKSLLKQEKLKEIFESTSFISPYTPEDAIQVLEALSKLKHCGAKVKEDEVFENKTV